MRWALVCADLGYELLIGRLAGAVPVPLDAVEKDEIV